MRTAARALSLTSEDEVSAVSSHTHTVQSVPSCLLSFVVVVCLHGNPSAVHYGSEISAISKKKIPEERRSASYFSFSFGLAVEGKRACAASTVRVLKSTFFPVQGSLSFSLLRLFYPFREEREASFFPCVLFRGLVRTQAAGAHTRREVQGRKVRQRSRSHAHPCISTYTMREYTYA